MIYPFITLLLECVATTHLTCDFNVVATHSNQSVIKAYALRIMGKMFKLSDFQNTISHEDILKLAKSTHHKKYVKFPVIRCQNAWFLGFFASLTNSTSLI
jgi:hypothetical protein